MPIIPVVDVKSLDRTRPQYGPLDPGPPPSSAAGLLVPVSCVYEDLQQHPVFGMDGRPRRHQRSTSSHVYIASVLQCLMAEVLKSAGNAAKEEGVCTIEPDHIGTALKKDEKLLKLVVALKGDADVTGGETPAVVETDQVQLFDLNADWLQIVFYHVETVHLIQSCSFVCKSWREMLHPDSNFWKRRFLSLYHLKPRGNIPDEAYLQDSSLVISKHNFEIMVGDIIEDYHSDTEMTEEAVDVLQAAAEDHVIKYMEDLARLEEREGREVDEEMLNERDDIRLQRSERLIDRLIGCDSDDSTTNDTEYIDDPIAQEQRQEIERRLVYTMDEAEREGPNLTDDEDWANDESAELSEWYDSKWRRVGTCLQYYIDLNEKPRETIDRADYQLWCSLNEEVPPQRWKGLVTHNIPWLPGDIINTRGLIEEMIEEGSSNYLREYWGRSCYDFASSVMGLHHIREELDGEIFQVRENPMVGRRHRVVEEEAEWIHQEHLRQPRLHCSWNKSLPRPPTSLDVIRSKATAHVKGLELFHIIQDGWPSHEMIRHPLPIVDIFSLFARASDALSAEEKKIIGQMQPRQYDGYNLLHMAIDCMPDDPENCERMVRRLMEEYGISVRRQTETDGYTAIDLATENGRGGLLKVLRDYEEENTETVVQLKKMKVIE
ncbi:histone H3-like [Planoprotostelium fungivorum]|uniref:Histone H3-like n=1 Tax=Planoprotostelium fungivorum TaxID=1890364 RepID=A0A2P6NTK4_9EUKA|nr:histone H3-like [Planoprotostelium fungivorum]